MMELSLKWKRKVGQYQTGERLYLNQIIVGGYEWNGTRPQGSQEDDRWSGRINLPSLKTTAVFSDTEQKVKDKIEGIVREWFNEALNAERK